MIFVLWEVHCIILCPCCQLVYSLDVHAWSQLASTPAWYVHSLGPKLVLQFSMAHFEQASLLATAWANHDVVSTMALQHALCVLPVKTKQSVGKRHMTISRGDLLGSCSC